MKSLVEKLQHELHSKINNINDENSPILGHARKVELVEGAITEMRHYLRDHPFPDKATEISCHKHWMPFFYKLHFYFTALYQLELERNISGNEGFLRHVETEKKRVTGFLEENHALHCYFHSQRTNEDDIYFLPRSTSGTAEFLVADARMCKASLVLGQLLAYKEYRDFLDKESKRIKGQEDKVDDEVELEWAGSKADAVEWVVSWYETKLATCKGQPATLDQLKRWMQKKLQVEMKDFAVIDNNNRNRKKTTSPLLEKMILAVKKRADRLDP